MLMLLLALPLLEILLFANHTLHTHSSFLPTDTLFFMCGEGRRATSTKMVWGTTHNPCAKLTQLLDSLGIIAPQRHHGNNDHHVGGRSTIGDDSREAKTNIASRAQ
uniref:Putative secreted protein n=1 Tax=Anopheles triannulatus TaxID=58253 RepID=A0A2M4B1Y6_9DIPT